MDTLAGGSLETLRRSNRSRVVEVLQAHGRASRVDIGRETGLARTTVSSLVAELIAEGLVVERSEDERRFSGPSGGRPATLLSLDPRSGGFAGIDFAHDGVRVVLVDRAGTMLEEAHAPLDVDRRAEEAIATGCAMVGTLLDRAGMSRDRLLAAGVAVSAPVRTGTRSFASQAIFPAWAGVDVAQALAELGVPVFVGNDANLGALAEARFGAGLGCDNLLYVMLAAGVGAGLLLDGRLYEGHTGTAGELGHVVVEPGGQICRCGNRGCLETVSGAAALTGALRHSHGEIALTEVLALVRAKDAGAMRVVADAGRAVGATLAGMCSMFDPGLVIVGGELAAAGEPLLDGIRESVERATSASTGRTYDVIAGALGARAEALGAAALAMANVAEQALTI